MNSIEITITIQKHKWFDCFRLNERPVRRQNLVVIDEETNT